MASSIDHDFLCETARDFVSKETRVGDLRLLREQRSGFDHALWGSIVSLGWPGIVFAEEIGGQDLGYSTLGIVLTELGRSLTPTPFLSTVVLAGEAIRSGGSVAQREAILPDIMQGRRFLAFAHQEGAAFRPYDIGLSAESTEGGHVLRGVKTHVLDAHAADSFVAVARTSGAPGERDRGAEILDRVLDRGAASLASEMLGGIEECFSRTIAYLQERRQFGVPIGSFQALQHRAAEWYCEVELTRAIVEKALHLLDEGDPAEASAITSAAKARASEVFMHSAAEAIQMFGGVGMTDAHDIGFFLKRARVAEQTLGDSSYHRAHFAEVRGF